MKSRRALVLLAFLAATYAGEARSDTDKFNPSLRLLWHERLSGRAKESHLAELEAARADKLSVTIEFDHELSHAEIMELERAGLSFVRFDGEIAHTGAIYPASILWENLEELAARKYILRIESVWRPCVFPLLDISAHEIEADSAWGFEDSDGVPITGRGTRIADFDTGIDVFHPSFFYADGDTFDWIDTDGWGTFDPGFDCVDLDKDSFADPGEILNFWDGWVYDPAHVWGGGENNNVANGFQPCWDWLYNDANGNSARDYGIEAGFDENDPTYGERLFIVLDDNRNGLLEPGEKLVSLRTSKIYAALGAGSTVYLRGSNLIETESDTYGHGTPVSGILAGGTPRRQRFTGIAPDAEILMGYYFSGNSIATCISWARSMGADVMLYEFGGFVWDYLDGSSLDEELISAENENILQVVPSGNLGRGRKHAIAVVPALDSISLSISVPSLSTSITSIWPTILWRTQTENLIFRLKSPIGNIRTIDGYSGLFDNYYVYSEKSESPRGTCALFAYVSNGYNVSLAGTWQIRIINVTQNPIEIIANVADDVTSWGGGAEFSNYYTDDRNVTWPATADNAFVNGSYSTRGFEGYGGTGSGSISPGEISAFSGRGQRIDGAHLLDIVSPGNYDVYSTRTSQDGAGYPLGSYRQFSGTSAAGPHVAAAAALVKQAFPQATPADISMLLTSHAAVDDFTGPVYNDTYGWGKLRILAAIGAVAGTEEIAQGPAPARAMLGQNYPNPFNPVTWIPFFIPSYGHASIKIYNIRGKLVKTLAEGMMDRGSHSVVWKGDDNLGRPAASGIYLCTLSFENAMQTRKLVLIR